MAQMSHPGVRALIAQRGDSCVGLGSRDDPPGRLRRYVEFGWKNDNYQQAVGMAKSQSACMITCGSLLRECGYHCVELDEPYAKRNGMIGPIMQRIGAREKAWYAFTVAADRNRYLHEDNAGGFNTADMFWIGLEDAKGIPVPGYGGLSHMGTIVDQRQIDVYDKVGKTIVKPGVDMLVSVDGGQLDLKGGYCISYRYRYVERVGDAYWMRTLEHCKDGKGEKIDDLVLYQRDVGRRIWAVLDPVLIGQIVTWAESRDDFTDDA